MGDFILDEEEIALQSTVFGEDVESVPFGEENSMFDYTESFDVGMYDDQPEHPPTLWMEDKKGDSSNLHDSMNVGDGDLVTEISPNKSADSVGDGSSLLPAWEDLDEEEVLINLPQTRKFKKLRTEASETTISGVEFTKRQRKRYRVSNYHCEWAKLPEKGDVKSMDDEDEDILGSSASLLVPDSNKIPPRLLRSSRMTNINQKEKAKGVINSAQFHPNGQIALTAGTDKTLRMYQVDGMENKKIQGVFLKSQITCASFTPDGKHIIASGKYPHLFKYDIQSGKVVKIFIDGRKERTWRKFEISPTNQQMALIGHQGYIVIVSLITMKWIGHLKMNAAAQDMSYNSDGSELFSVDANGEVYIWDPETHECLHRHQDNGSINSTCIAVSPNDQLYAVGSASGIVNLYRNGIETRSKKDPPPLKIVDNLVDTITVLRFNHDSQLLAFACSASRDSVRMLHVPSRTVYTNWPGQRSSFKNVNSIDFSPNSGYVLIGNRQSKVLLFRLNHYKQI